MTNVARKVIRSLVDESAYSPLILFPVIGIYFESKAHEAINKSIKELIKEHKKSNQNNQINCVISIQHLIESKHEFYNISRFRDLCCVALVIEAFALGFFPHIFALYFIGIFCVAAIISHVRIQDCDKAKKNLIEGRNTIPVCLLVDLSIK